MAPICTKESIYERVRRGCSPYILWLHCCHGGGGIPLHLFDELPQFSREVIIFEVLKAGGDPHSHGLDHSRERGGTGDAHVPRRL